MWITTEANVRIRSYADFSLGAIEASWTVRPSQASERMPQIWAELEALQRCEPSRDWRLEVRGEDSDWHEWKD